MSSDPNWDDRSSNSGAPTSSSSRRANLFSKWRHSHRPDRTPVSGGEMNAVNGVGSSGGVGTAAGGGGGGHRERPHHRHANATGEISSSAGHYGGGGASEQLVAESLSSNRRGSAPGVSSSAMRAAARNSGGDSHRHRSRSRPRDRNGDGGGVDPSQHSGSTPSSASSHRRHRSKSRTKSRPRDRPGSGRKDGRSSDPEAASATGGGDQQQQTLQGVAREESLRDYWKRRAEESKERVGSAADPPAGAGTGNPVGAPGANPNSNNSSSWGEKVDEDDSTRGSGSRASGGGVGGGSTGASTSQPPPPPPRDHRRHPSGHSQARAKSRGKGDRELAASTTSNTPGSTGTPRKVDSIASALVGHARKNSSSSLAPPMPSSSSRSSRPQAAASPSRASASSAGITQTPSSHHHHSNGIRDSNGTSGTTTTEDLSSLSPLHHSLATASWPALHSHIQSMKAQSGNTNNNNALSEIAGQLSLPHPRLGGTVLHVAAWKAPPALAVAMIRLMPRDSREMSVLQSIRDGEGNTPLHLCCANLDCRDDGSSDPSNGSGSTSRVDYLAVLREICVSVPPKAWTVQNSEGDTPLHMLVSSPLCSADWRSSPGNSSSMSSSNNNNHHNINNNPRAKLAMEAMQIALSTAESIDACLIPERTGATPLHIALASGAHECVVEALLSARPESSMAEDGRGMLPLHWAAAFGRASYGVVKRLVEEYAVGLTSSSQDGDIPLHLAVSNAAMEGEDGGVGGRRDSSTGSVDAGDSSSSKVDKNRLKIVELLMHDAHVAVGGRRGDAPPDVKTPILTTNREKLTPLHCCALFDAPPQISKLLMKHPDANAASSMTNSFGATPLHLAAAQPGVSQSIATVLAIGSPDAAAVQDRLKRTPLHVAAQNTYATNLLIKTLAELNPNAASVKTQRGHLPLHLAAQSQAKEAVIRALIKAHPAAAEARNKSNNTPLHDAAKYRASLGVVRLLLDAYPGALYVQNQYGNLPLHCATAYQAPSDVVQLLLKSWPEGASMQNRNQDAPLHYAAAYATSVSSVRPLIEAAPAAVLLLNSSGQSPVDRAKANNAPGDIVKLLENAAVDYSRNATSGDGSWASFGQQQHGGGGQGGSSALSSF